MIICLTHFVDKLLWDLLLDSNVHRWELTFLKDLLRIL